MEQTAVKWLYKNLKSHFEHDGDLLEVVQFSFEQAKEIESQQQRYSEEEVLELLNKSCDYIYDSSKIGTDKKLMPNLLRGWFEQFKKK